MSEVCRMCVCVCSGSHQSHMNVPLTLERFGCRAYALSLLKLVVKLQRLSKPMTAWIDMEFWFCFCFLLIILHASISSHWRDGGIPGKCEAHSLCCQMALGALVVAPVGPLARTRWPSGRSHLLISTVRSSLRRCGVCLLHRIAVPGTETPRKGRA